MKKSILLFLFAFLSLAAFSQNPLSGSYSPTPDKAHQAEALWVDFNIESLKNEIVDSLKIKRVDANNFFIYLKPLFYNDKINFFQEVSASKITSSNLNDYYKEKKNTYIKYYSKYQVSAKTMVQSNSLTTQSINGPCTNMDFEDGTLNGWDGSTGQACTDPDPCYLTSGFGIATNQHTILSGGTDPLVGATLPVVCPGGKYSLRLEDIATGGHASRISQTFLVTAANANYTYNYAVVLEDPVSGHSDPERPYFKVKLTDQNGNEIACAAYNVIAKPPISNFQQVYGTNYYYRNWTSVSVPLFAYIGQNVTIQFTASDCSQGGHLGYAYIDGSCFPLQVTSNAAAICSGQSATLTAPAGFGSYSWTGPGIISGATSQNVFVNKAGTYNVSLGSVSDIICYSSLSFKLDSIAHTDAGPNINMCPGDTVQLKGSGGGVSYTWSPATGLSNPNIQNPKASPLTTTKYYTTSCGVKDSVTVTVVPGFTVSASPPINKCNTAVNLSVTPNIAGTYTYSWTPASSLTGANTATPSANPITTTYYHVTVKNSQGCSKTDSVKVNVKTIASLKILANSDSLCLGEHTQLNALIKRNCGTNGNNCPGATSTVQLGTSSFGGSTDDITPYDGYNSSSKRQYLFTAAELNAAGITLGTIQKMGFYIYAGIGYTYSNFTIRMGCTSLTSLGTTFVADLQTVFNPKNITTISGYNSYNFDYKYDWDGASNIIVEVCYAGTGTFNSSVYYTPTTFTSCTYTYGTSVCDALTGYTSTSRPNTYFEYCTSSPLSLTYQWSPSTALTNATIINPVATPTTTTTYKLTVTESANGCTTSDSIKILVGPNFTISKTGATKCSSAGVPISVTPSSAGSYTYQWSPGATLTATNTSTTTANPASTTWYYAKVSSSLGCIKRDSVKVLVPNISAIRVSPHIDSLCIGKSSSLSSALIKNCGTNGSNTGSLTTVQTGTGIYASNSDNLTPYDGNNTSAKRQFLYTVAELNALGMSAGSTIKQIGFNIYSVGSTTTYDNFTIKAGCTSTSNLYYSFEPNLQTVFTPKSVLLTYGVNYYNFDNSYDWDGVSNIVIEICYNNTTAAGSSYIYYTPTSFASSNYNYGTGSCNFSSAFSYSFNRPDTYFKYGTGIPPKVYYLWSPSVGINNTTIPNPIITPVSSGFYVLKATDSTTGCIFKDSVKVLAGPFFSTTTTGINKCSAASVPLSVTPNSGGTFTYSWTPSYNLTGANTSTPSATPSATTTYYVKVASSLGCIVTDSVKVFVNKITSLRASASKDSICTGESSQLKFTLVNNCGTNQGTCTSPNTVQLGSNTYASNNDAITPYNGYYNSSRKQMLITKAELNALGIIQGSTIQQIGFMINSISGTVYNNFTIRMGCTSLTDLSYTFVPNLQLVFTPKTVTTLLGINNYNFDNSYDWDGVSNLIVEMCYSNPSSINSSYVFYTNTINTSMLYAEANNEICNVLMGNPSVLRPVMYFKYCTSTGLSYLWSPATGLNNAAITNPIATPGSSTTYKITIKDSLSGCITKDSLKIQVGNPFTLDVRNDTSLCKNQSIKLNTIIGPGSYIYQWTPVSGLDNASIASPIATLLASTKYLLRVKSSDGCIKKDSVTINISGVAPNLTLQASSPVCKGTQVPITAQSLSPCGLNGSTCSGTEHASSLASNLSYVTYPFSGYYQDGRMQVLFTAAELKAAGITSAETIKSLAFNVGSKSSTIPYNGFTIRIGCTSLTQLTYTFETVPNIVYNPKSVSTVGGWNTFLFDNAYDWDGTSNLIVEVCWDNNNYTYYDYVTYNITSFSSAHYAYMDNSTGCTLTGGSTSTNRPDIRFSSCPGVSSSTTYAWLPATNLSASNISNPVATINKSTTYTLTASSGGCISTKSITIAVDTSLKVKAAMDTVCTNGVPIPLHATISPQNALPATLSCGLSSTTACASPANYQLGTLNYSSSSYGPFYGYYMDHKVQYLIQASDLISAGMNSGTITKMNFNIISKYSTAPYNGFTIRMGCTNATSMTGSSWLATSGIVYGPQSYSSVAGINTFNFSTPFNWDGTSNLLVEICWDNNSYTSYDYVYYTNTSYYSTQLNFQDNAAGCSLSPSIYYVYTGRPVITFGVCPIPVLTYNWSPVAGLSDATSANPVATISSPAVFKIIVNGGKCPAVDSVLVQPSQKPVITKSSDQHVCESDSIQLHASGGTKYQWGPATGLSNPAIADPKALPASDTKYGVRVSNDLGCYATDSVLVYSRTNDPSCIALSVKFISFTVKKASESSALIEWITESETNNSHFEIQRTSDFSSWKTVGTVKGAGNTNQLSNYNFTDEGLTEEKYYYRIKQIDYSGNSSLSKVESVIFNNAIIQVIPTYASVGSAIKIMNPSEIKLSITIYDMSGKSFSENIESDKSITEIYSDRLAQGMYIIRVSYADGVLNQKIILY